jgi:hypothetical protein
MSDLNGDDLDDLLGSLSQGPVPPLAPSDLVRRRGEQRRVRTRLATGLASAVVVASVAGTALAVAGSGGDDSLVVPPLTSTPSAVATAEPTVDPTTEPTSEPTSTPTDAPASGTNGAFRLVQPEDAGLVAGGRWTRSPAVEASSALLQICAAADTHGSAGLRASLNRGGTDVQSQVITVPSAATTLSRLKADLNRCPSRPADSADGRATASFALVSAADRRVVVRETDRDCDTCPATESLWIAVNATDEAVGYLQLPSTEQSRLTAWGDVAADRSGCVEKTCSVGADGCDRTCTGTAPTRGPGFPESVTSGVPGDHLFAVYLAVVRNPMSTQDTAKLKDADDAGQAVGYYSYRGTLDCDSGAVEALHLDPQQSYSKSALYFDAAAKAVQFVSAYQPGVVGTAEITVTCYRYG